MLIGNIFNDLNKMLILNNENLIRNIFINIKVIDVLFGIIWIEILINLLS